MRLVYSGSVNSASSVNSKTIGVTSRISNALTHGLWVAHQAALSLEIFRQEYWSALLLPSPGNLPNLGIEPGRKKERKREREGERERGKEGGREERNYVLSLKTV